MCVIDGDLLFCDDCCICCIQLQDICFFVLMMVFFLLCCDMGQYGGVFVIDEMWVYFKVYVLLGCDLCLYMDVNLMVCSVGFMCVNVVVCYDQWQELCCFGLLVKMFYWVDIVGQLDMVGIGQCVEIYLFVIG